MLKENPDGNLTAKQVEFASTIHSSGADLLDLINEILDLSKIESGAMEVNVQATLLTDLRDQVERTFRQIAESKGLDFDIRIAPDAPPTVETDAKRLQQVLKNLLSNAFKFTEHGGVTLDISVARSGWSRDAQQLAVAPRVLAFSVSDTGIGIPPEKHRIIFEAFQQADGTTSRRYGGTGLGLSISRELARLLGGEIRISSAVGQGSTFVLYIPQGLESLPGSDLSGTGPSSVPAGTGHMGLQRFTRTAALASLVEHDPPAEIDDDRETIASDDKTVLIVEDDVPFARILLSIAREKGFKGIVTSRGEHAIALAHKYRPDAITLDMQLADIDGLRVLDMLKHDAATRHIPVHVVSVSDDRQRTLTQGALSHLTKPVTAEALQGAFASMRQFIDRRVRNLLVVEDDDRERASIVELIGNNDVHTTAVATGEEALEALAREPFDCMVLDLGLADMTGLELLERLREQGTLATLPVIVYTGRELSKRDETELRRLADTIIIKDVKSPDRLLDETALFLHRVQENLPPAKRQILERLHHADPILEGRKVLIIDDDIRNIFALTSVLEQYRMDVVYAENGKDGIDLLRQTPDVSVVLMDVMMPEMDGYAATRAIRAMPEFDRLPIIALTAKAMKGDRELCIEAGASDYITKPVDTDQLVSLLRVWLYR
jgi:CheY-like chemotaxis protein